MASLLCKKGWIIVDDYSRYVENKYANKFIGKDKLFKIIENKLSIFKI